MRSGELTCKINSIYFGGGTPSIINEIELEKILNAIREKYSVSKKAEITIECNPDDVCIKKINAWKKNGINRISLGIQSFFDSDLALMNRSHNSKAAIESKLIVRENATRKSFFIFLY